MSQVTPLATLPAAVPLTGPLPLAAQGRRWQVVAGQVELYFQAAVAGLPGGRCWLHTLAAGDLLCEPTAATLMPGVRLLALGQEAVLVELDAARLPAPDTLTTLTAGWLAHWCAPLTVPPVGAEAHRLGGAQTEPTLSLELTLRRGARAAAGDGVVWVRLDAGSAVLIGAEAALLPGGQWLPLCRPLWLEARASDTRLSVRGAAQLPAADLLPTADWQRILWERLLEAERANLAAASARLQRSHDHQEQRLSRALAGLVRTTEADAPLESSGGGGDESPLLRACRQVGAWQGIDGLRAPAGDRHGRREADPVLAIARASQVRVRQVLLREGWQRRDHGPLLAYRRLADGAPRPVALLPDGPDQYRLVDPQADDEPPRVNAAIAATIVPQAYSFTTPLQARSLHLLYLWQFAAQGLRPDLIRLLLAILGGALLGLLVPLLTRILFDEVVPLADYPRLWEVGAWLLLATLAALLLQLAQGILTLRLEAQGHRNLEQGLFDRLLRLPAAFFRRFTAGDLADRASAVSQIRRLLSQQTMAALFSGGFSLLNLLVLFYFDARLGLIGLAAALLVLTAVIVSGVLTVRYRHPLYEQQGRISGLLVQLLTGISKLRSAGAESRAFSVWATLFARQRWLAYRAGQVQNAFAVFQTLFPPAATLALLAWVLHDRLSDPQQAISTGVFIAAVAAFGQLLGGTLGFGSALIGALDLVPLYRRARPLLEQLPESGYGRRDPGALRGAITVRHLHYRFEPHGPLILDDVSLEVRPGEMVAIVGPSGAGKSTLLRLLLALEQPESGTIYYDGQALATLDVDALRRQMGTVLQNGQLQSGDIYSTIVGRSSHLTLEDAWEAARLAGLEADIRALPMGMQTLVTAGGQTFSGGQRQRLLIARAIVHRPPLLFFDEATSALDNRTQEQVTASLAQLAVTRVVIAHRLSTIRHADRIYVMEQGRVVESGTYAELSARSGPFAALVERQLCQAHDRESRSPY